MTRKCKLLSLFDGSGGFGLAASMCGIEPVAASEIEPFPIAVTRSRFPNMKHLGTVPTLVARGPSAVAVRYIVRRLTPTECARLQGFPDTWGHPDSKENFTDEEYRFWCDVYLTKMLIDGKVEHNDDGNLVYTTSRKPYTHKTKPQMLKWYNGLHTDSAEYKMWGNGIALPPALYCMQGMAEALEEETNDER